MKKTLKKGYHRILAWTLVAGLCSFSTIQKSKAEADNLVTLQLTACLFLYIHYDSTGRCLRWTLIDNCPHTVIDEGPGCPPCFHEQDLSFYAPVDWGGNDPTSDAPMADRLVPTTADSKPVSSLDSQKRPENDRASGKEANGSTISAQWIERDRTVKVALEPLLLKMIPNWEEEADTIADLLFLAANEDSLKEKNETESKASPQK
mgnify:FL=1